MQNSLLYILHLEWYFFKKFFFKKIHLFQRKGDLKDNRNKGFWPNFGTFSGESRPPPAINQSPTQSLKYPTTLLDQS